MNKEESGLKKKSPEGSVRAVRTHGVCFFKGVHGQALGKRGAGTTGINVKKVGWGH